MFVIRTELLFDDVICQIVNVPYIERPCEGTTSAEVEYQEEDMQDHVYQAVLRQSYNTFRVCSNVHHVDQKFKIYKLNFFNL